MYRVGIMKSNLPAQVRCPGNHFLRKWPFFPFLRRSFLLDTFYKDTRLVLPVRSIGSGSGGNFRLPLVAVSKELFLVI